MQFLCQRPHASGAVGDRGGKPFYYLLEDVGFELMLVNARDVKNLPQDRPVDRTIGPGLAGGECGVPARWLGSLSVSNGEDVPRELSGLVVPQHGSLEATGDLFEPYRLVDAGGEVVVPVSAFFAELAACGRPDDAAFVWDGPAALVPVPVGARGGLG